jgi:hypothetical protein
MKIFPKKTPVALKLTGLKLKSKNLNLKKKMSGLEDKKVMRIKSLKSTEKPELLCGSYTGVFKILNFFHVIL